MNPNASFDNISNKNIFLSDICNIHKEKYISYCKLCSLEICNKCLCSHYNHELINFKKIKPKNEEIDLLKESIKNYKQIFNNILSQIFSWKKSLEKIITSFQHDLNDNQKINENINFVFNNNIYNYSNYNSILKFRQIFNSIIEPQKSINNNKILNYMMNGYNNNIFDENKMGLYEYNNYNKIKLCLEKLMHYNNNSNLNENNFLYNTNCIIDILWENYISKKNNNNNKYNNTNKKIIEKYIDLSKNKKIPKNKFILMKQQNPIDLYKTQTTFKPNIGNIFLEQNNLNTSNDIINDFKHENYILDNNTPRTIYCKKRSNSNNILFWNKNRKNISFNINEFNTNLNINKINFIVKNGKSFFQNKKNASKIESQNQPKNKERTFIHKKFEFKNPTNLKKFVKNSSKKETNIDTNELQKTPKILCKTEKNKIYGNNSFFLNNSNNKLNSTCNSSNKIKQKLNFDFLGNDFNLLSNDLIKENEIIYKLPTNKINNINNTNINNKSNISNNIKYTYNLSPNQILCIGLELGNFNCKLGIMNPNPNQKNNLYTIFDSIPFILSFNENKDEIEIGQEAFNSFINKNETKIIINIIDLIWKNFDEINKNEIYFDKINCNEKNKPYIKINLHNKEKKYNFEDLFIIYIKRLFQKFFEKIEIKGDDKNILQINLVIAIPDNINYFQRKIIEKIFQTQIFPSYNEINDISSDDNSKKNYKLNSVSIHSGSSKGTNKKLYGGYQIILKDIKIENASSIVHMSFTLEENKSKNILALIANGNIINISLANIYKEEINNEIKDIYEIKRTITLEKGEFNLIYDFIEKMSKSYKDDNDMTNLKRNCYKFFYENNKGNDNIVLLNEFIKSLDSIYKEIISSLQKILQEEKINETNINQIIIEGKILQTKSFINLISNIFKNNKEIIQDIKNITNNNIIKGTVIQSFNLSKESPLQILKNISPMSFGIDSFGKMEFIIKKGTKIPNINNKCVKIKNDKNLKKLPINIYEGENEDVKRNRLISSISIDKIYIKNENIYEDFVELMIQFELDCYLDLKMFVLDTKTLKKRVECLIKIDVIKE